MDYGIIILVAIVSPIAFYFVFMLAFPTFITLRDIWTEPNPLWARLYITCEALLYFLGATMILTTAIWEYGVEGLIGMIIGGSALHLWFKNLK